MRAHRALAPLLVLALLAGCGGDGGSPASGTQAPKSSERKAAKHATPAKPRIVSGPHDAAVPVLMYHVINAPPAGAPYPELWVPAERFAEEMQALHARGYHGVTLNQVADYWKRGYALPSKPIVISFDDGYLSQYTKAAPALRALHWPGVLNLALVHLGEAGGLSRHQVRALIGWGWEIDSHTIDHVDMTTIDAATMHHELAGSRARLRRIFHVPVRFFCYPSGRFNDAVVAAVRAAGYDGATTTEPGLARPADPYRLARIRVNGTDSSAAVLARIAAAGD